MANVVEFASVTRRNGDDSQDDETHKGLHVRIRSRAERDEKKNGRSAIEMRVATVCVVKKNYRTTNDLFCCQKIRGGIVDTANGRAKIYVTGWSKRGGVRRVIRTNVVPGTVLSRSTSSLELWRRRGFVSARQSKM